MPLVIDRSLYASSPRISIGSGATLIGQLLDAVADPALEASTALVEGAKELRKVLAQGRAVDLAATQAAATATAAGDIQLDQRADRITKALMLRLQACVLLDDGAPARRAAEHLGLLYPDGLAFTRSTFASQDSVMQRMLTQMKDPALLESLEELIGANFIAAFTKTAKAYHKMVKAMGRVVTSTVDQRSVLLEMQSLIVQHASRVLGELRDSDPRSVERTRGLLAPIDNFRARTNRGSSAPKPTAEPAPEPIAASEGASASA